MEGEGSKEEKQTTKVTVLVHGKRICKVRKKNCAENMMLKKFTETKKGKSEIKNVNNKNCLHQSICRQLFDARRKTDCLCQNICCIFLFISPKIESDSY